MRFLGIDYGNKKVGIALSDETGTIAIPHSIMRNTHNLLDAVQKIVAREGVGAVVVGASRDYNGAENPIMDDIKRFKKHLERVLAVPVRFESEILTSYEARRHTAEERVDAAAAALILQSYLDRIKHAP